MTPQILLNALTKAFLKVEMISLMVIDECHNATGNHPYARIMKVRARTHFFWCFLWSYLISHLFVHYLFSPVFENIFTNDYCLLLVKEFYHRANEKPMIFGMTASPVVKKGNILCASQTTMGCN